VFLPWISSPAKHTLPSSPSFQAESWSKTEFSCKRILIGKATLDCSLPTGVEELFSDNSIARNLCLL
jgi:hypothetical protein